jgi:hypothetical protein
MHGSDGALKRVYSGDNRDLCPCGYQSKPICPQPGRQRRNGTLNRVGRAGHNGPMGVLGAIRSREVFAVFEGMHQAGASSQDFGASRPTA